MKSNVAVCFLVFTFISKAIFTKLIKRLQQLTFKSEIKCFEENTILINTPGFGDLREHYINIILLFFLINFYAIANINWY